MLLNYQVRLRALEQCRGPWPSTGPTQGALAAELPDSPALIQELHFHGGFSGGNSEFHYEVYQQRLSECPCSCDGLALQLWG